MTPRDTRTGGMLEEMILPALQMGGYSYEKQKVIGTRLGGRRHRVDVVAQDAEGRTYLVSLKWQQVSGTTEQKVPFEVMCLADAVLKGKCDKAYLVLGGDGWTLDEYYLSDQLREHLRHAELVNIVTLNGFIAKADQGEL